jgi:hypothetical protein
MRHVQRTIHLPPDEVLEALVARLVPRHTPVRHHFTPHGLSLGGLGPHGSVVVHTWPEHRLATVDAWGDAALQLDAALLATVVSPPTEAPCPTSTPMCSSPA